MFFNVYRDCLLVSDMLYVCKVIEYVYEKVVGNENVSNLGNYVDKEYVGLLIEEEFEELLVFVEVWVEFFCYE